MLLNSFILDPFITVSEANSREHWRVSNRRHNSQKFLIKRECKDLSTYSLYALKIRLIRISPRMLDGHDNLTMAFKWVVDALADILYPGLKVGRADDSPLIEWEYAQEKGKPKQKAIRIEVYER